MHHDNNGYTHDPRESDFGVLYNIDMTVERAIPSDAPEIAKLIDENTMLMFGDVDINEMLCKGLITLVGRDQEGKITTAVSFNTYPNVPILCSSHWQRWVSNLFKVDGLSSKNALWMHFVVHDIASDANFMKPILEKLFHLQVQMQQIKVCGNLCNDSSIAYPYYKYCLILCPPGCAHMVVWFKKHTLRVLPIGHHVAKRIMTLRIAHQKNFVKNYKMRRAVEEDNDDLIPLINSHSTRLKEIYGEFYISEILKRQHDMGRQIIVAEYQTQAVAVLFLKDDVNVKSLNEYFELEPFHGLCKPCEEDMTLQKVDDREKGKIVVPDDEEEEEEEEEENKEEEYEDETYKQKIHKRGDIDDEDLEDSFSSSESSSSESTRIVDASTLLHQIQDKIDLDPVLLEGIRRKVTSVITSPSQSTSSSSEFSIVIDLSNSSDEFESKQLGKEFKSLYDKDLSLLRLGEAASDMIYGHSDTELDKLIQYSLSVKTDDEVVDSSPKFEVDVTEYFGESNAFAIEIAASWPVHEQALFHLLTTCFECYPAKSMCVLTLPSTTKPFPLLQHFVRATPRNISNYPHELYIVHKNSVAGFVNIRLAKKYDLLQINSFLSSIKTEEDYLSLFIHAFKMKYITYLILCGTDLVGTCILKNENQVDFLKRCYELEEVTMMNQHKRGYIGQIVHLVISPIFQPHASFFMREIHRISEYTLLTYKIYSVENEFLRRSKIITVILSNLLPIKPKRGLREEKYSNFQEYALYISTMYISSLPKIEINDRITIVGSSIITTSYLENLIYNKMAKAHIIFNNITVLAPHSATTPKQIMFKARDKFYIIHSEYLVQYIRLLNLPAFVNYTYGVMTGIDRKNKRLIVNSDSSIPYDVLFLLCGVQFPNPVFGNAKGGENSRNIYIVNTKEEASNCLAKLKRQVYTTTKVKYNIIVYGSCLETYTCIATLLEFGVEGSSIVFVEPPQCKKYQFVFPDSEVDTAVMDTMKEIGIRIYTGYKFIDCKFEEGHYKASHSIFESATHRLELECFAMFMYQDKCVSTKTFLAINRAGLVYDGRLVIGPDFQTNDPYIYAAGTLTKYSRKYYAEHMIQKYYNREEIGEKLANRALEFLLPSYDPECEKSTYLRNMEYHISNKNYDQLMPRFTRPIFEYCALPGYMYYLHVRKPGQEEPNETQMTDDNYGQILSTGDCKKLYAQGYFKIHLNQYNCVETITCLSKAPIDYRKMVSLFGKHERLLNNLVSRCEMAQIADFYTYFDQEWMSLLFHSEYKRCETNTMNALVQLVDEYGKSLVLTIVQQLEKCDWKNLEANDRNIITQKFKEANYKRIVEKHILNFIGENLEDFPMYAHPVVVRMLLQSAMSPLFQEM